MQLILPFRLGLDPMEKLLVATFKGDPEFEAIEPQLFDDAVNGKGMRVLRYRKDGRVDVYWQPGVRVDPNSFVVGTGIGDFAETTIDPAFFEISERGVDLHVAFTDSRGREIELRVREDADGKRGFPMLAPVGADIARPFQLFLVYMSDIDLVRRKGSFFEGRIGDRAVHPASLPVLLHGHRVLFIRYAARPVIGTLNPPMSQPLIFDLAAPGSADVDGMSVVADRDGKVTRISAGREPRQVEIGFLPGFPNLFGLTNGGSVSGRWSIRIAGTLITGGSYHALREASRIAVGLDVTEHWKPSGLPLSMEIFTRVVPTFRSWPSTYRWRGAIELGTMPAMSGMWERTGKQ